jgi:hypothetical protein
LNMVRPPTTEIQSYRYFERNCGAPAYAAFEQRHLGTAIQPP